MTGVDEALSRSGAILFAVGVGVIETALIVGYALSILLFDVRNQTSGLAGTTELAWPVLVGLLLVFGLLVGTVTWGVWRRRSAARTPFFLVQAFTVVSAWQLASSDTTWVRVAGFAAIAVAVAAAYVMLSGSGAAQLDR